jgi:hypothetical protein
MMVFKKKLRKLIEEEGPLKKDRFEALLFCHYITAELQNTVYPETLNILNINCQL